MPRPGPRPYECVRRAWHSDRHRPMRGSIIQQIFRVAKEAHRDATKKNREWQEKLPFVVFKAEEIMYSKANSEAEYMNPDTLWDRVNDAVNTIIRRDESTETGELLPPCVEAALNLGCVPVRASRSDRHSNPRNYLSSRAPEPVSTPPRVLHNTTDDGHIQSSPFPSSNQLNFSRPVTTMNPTRNVTEPGSHVVGNRSVAAPSSCQFVHDNISLGRNQLMTVDANAQLNSGSVYPLYYGTQHQNHESHSVPKIPENANPSTIFFGTPVCSSVLEPAETGIQNVLQANNREACEIPPETECDLSLRLGLSDVYPSTGKSLACTTGHVPRAPQEGGKLGEPSRQRTKEFCFFPEGVDLNLEASVRKGKSPFS